MTTWPLWFRALLGAALAGVGVWAAHRVWHAGGVLA